MGLEKSLGAFFLFVQAERLLLWRGERLRFFLRQSACLVVGVVEVCDWFTLWSQEGGRAYGSVVALRLILTSVDQCYASLSVAGCMARLRVVFCLWLKCPFSVFSWCDCLNWSFLCGGALRGLGVVVISGLVTLLPRSIGLLSCQQTDRDVMLCLQSYQGLRIDISLGY